MNSVRHSTQEHSENGLLHHLLYAPSLLNLISKNIFKNSFVLVHTFVLILWSFSSLRPFGGGSNLVVRPPSGLSRISMYVELNPLILQVPSIPSMHSCKFHVSGKETGSGALIFSLLSRGRLLCCHFIVLSEVCSCFFLFTAQERDFLLEKWIQWTSRSTKKSQENKYIFQSENVVSNRWKGERNLNLTLLLVIFNQTAGRHFSNRREEEFYGQSIII